MMHPYGHFFYSRQNDSKPSAQRPEGLAKVVAGTRKSSSEMWPFLQLLAMTVVIIAAVVVLTSLAG